MTTRECQQRKRFGCRGRGTVGGALLASLLRALLFVLYYYLYIIRLMSLFCFIVCKFYFLKVKKKF